VKDLKTRFLVGTALFLFIIYFINYAVARSFPGDSVVLFQLLFSLLAFFGYLRWIYLQVSRYLDDRKKK